MILISELSERQIAELAEEGSKHIYLTFDDQPRLSEGGVCEIFNLYNEMKRLCQQSTEERKKEETGP